MEMFLRCMMLVAIAVLAATAALTLQHLGADLSLLQWWQWTLLAIATSGLLAFYWQLIHPYKLVSRG